MSIRCCAPPLPVATEADFQISLDAIWRKLRPHLEWAQGFTLAVLFTRHPAPVEALRRQLQELLSFGTLPLRQFTLNEPGQTAEILTAVLASRPLDGKHPPLWLEMWRDAGSEDERQAQRRAVWEVLSRLNERRFLLERDVACPLVLVLPTELRKDIPSMTPDLWSVRAVTADLPTPAGRERGQGAGQAALASPPPVNLEPAAAEQEWLRLWNATADKRRLAPEAGFAAAEAALARMDIAAAREMAGQVLLAISQREETSGALRQRGIALDFLGDAELAAGQLPAALNAYRESLELRRALRGVTGDSPQALRDLSVSLNNVGGVEQALGRLDDALNAYRESLELRRALRGVTGDSPQALRDLSISLDNVGGVEQALGRLDDALNAYRESLELSRTLRSVTGDSPQALRDLSVSLDNVGGVEQALGRLDDALNAYRESLELRRRLLLVMGELPQTLTDLRYSLTRLAAIERAQGNEATAASLENEADEIKAPRS